MSDREMIKVLVTTDSEEARHEIAAMLSEAEDLQIAGVAGSGVEAVNLAAIYSPDVVVMDYDMPGLDGAEATRNILKENDRVQVIMLSLVNDPADIRHAMRAGARDYLIKPLAPGELVETVRWLIRERREYARMTAFVKKLRKAYQALFTDDKQVPANVLAFLEQQARENPQDRLVLETLAVAYARNRDWAALLPLAQHLASVTE